MGDIVYIAVTLFATSLGALAGIGGGVIIKPVFDALGGFSIGEISIISSCSVFAMSLISSVLGAKRFKEQKESGRLIIPVAAGSLAGGVLGEYIFSHVTADESSVKTVQNCILLALIVFVIIYMRRDDKKTFDCKSPAAAVLTGLFLGAVSAFLGIGGGPINVAVFTLVFGFGIKTAVTGSLVTILFAQGAKLIAVAVKDASAFHIRILPFAVAAGICGALIGRGINRKLSEKAVRACFIAVQVLIIILCLFNIVRNTLL